MIAEDSKNGRASLKLLLVGGAGGDLSEVRKSLDQIAEIELEIAETTVEVADALREVQADVVMVLGEDPTVLDYLQRLSQMNPHPALFAVLSERSSNFVRRALRAGAEEVLFTPLGPGEATCSLLKVSEARRRTRFGRGVVYSLVSGSGGVGVSSLAANLALTLRTTLDKQVAVVDLDLQSSDQSVLLNLEPSNTILDIGDPGKRLDSIQLESALCKHPSGIYLLAAPARIEDSELIAAGQIGAALDLMRQLFDVVLVDIGNHMNEITVAAVEHSDQILYVLEQSVSSVRRAWRFMELMTRLGLREVEPRLVINRFVARHTVGEEQITKTLAQPIFARIPRDDSGFERAISRGQGLLKASPNSPVRKSIEELARKLSPTPIQSENGHGGLLSWLFAASSV